MNIMVTEYPDEMNIFVGRRLSTESLIPGITEFINPTHPKVAMPIYTPEQVAEADLVSDCCSATIHGDNPHDGICSQCGEHCGGVPLE